MKEKGRNHNQNPLPGLVPGLTQDPDLVKVKVNHPRVHLTNITREEGVDLKREGEIIIAVDIMIGTSIPETEIETEEGLEIVTELHHRRILGIIDKRNSILGEYKERPELETWNQNLGSLVQPQISQCIKTKLL